jgi:hypothetical protein
MAAQAAVRVCCHSDGDSQAAAQLSNGCLSSASSAWQHTCIVLLRVVEAAASLFTSNRKLSIYTAFRSACSPSELCNYAVVQLCMPGQCSLAHLDVQLPFEAY